MWSFRAQLAQVHQNNREKLLIGEVKKAPSEHETQRVHKDSSFISRDALRKVNRSHANGNHNPNSNLWVREWAVKCRASMTHKKVKVNQQQFHNGLSNMTSAWAFTDNNMSFQGPLQSLNNPNDPKKTSVLRLSQQWQLITGCLFSLSHTVIAN